MAQRGLREARDILRVCFCLTKWVVAFGVGVGNTIAGCQRKTAAVRAWSKPGAVRLKNAFTVEGASRYRNLSSRILLHKHYRGRIRCIAAGRAEGLERPFQVFAKS